FGLSNHDKKDSQGVCFIGPLDMKDFLQTKIKTKTGKIFHLDGRVLGVHDGVYYYTIGQRHGLDIGIGGGPYYVVSKDIKKNIIYVGEEKDLYSKNLKVSEISWVGKEPKIPVQINVRLRYRAGLKKAIFKKNGVLELKTPERAITSGQSAVFYKKEELLGGGVIE
ncbi:MAG: tRNA 2-thiouridine(34) synthase MnmA, partial [bacterium]|nr:tRNA 2-thiouridine(34) synthase MnmA [bacterium]